MSKRLILISLLLVAVSTQSGLACNGYKYKEPTTDALDVVSDILKAPCKLLETAIGLGAPLTGALITPKRVHAGVGKPKTKRTTNKKETPGAPKEAVTDTKRTATPEERETTPTVPKLEATPKPSAPPEATVEPPFVEPFPELQASPEESPISPRPIAPEIRTKRLKPKPAPSERKRYRPLPCRKAPCWQYWY
jgi:hypothetical protein